MKSVPFTKSTSVPSQVKLDPLPGDNLLQHDLLSPDEEIHLIKAYQGPEYDPASDTFIPTTDHNGKPLTKKSKAAYDKLIPHNMRLVEKVVQKYRYPGDSIPDLRQEGVLGLQRAIFKFDLSKGGRLSTYAVPWIYRAISRYRLETMSTIRLPVHLREKAFSLNAGLINS